MVSVASSAGKRLTPHSTLAPLIGDSGAPADTGDAALDPEEYAPLVSLFAIAALRPLPLQSVTVLVAGSHCSQIPHGDRVRHVPLLPAPAIQPHIRACAGQLAD